MSKLMSKSVSESITTSRKLVMPDQINPGGSLFGGEMMAWIDKLAAMCAMRHCQLPVVTASIDQINFLAPVLLADHVIMSAKIVYVGTTSMEIRVDVETENPIAGVRRKTTQAYLTFVALDENRKPVEVPKLVLETEEDKEEFKLAKKRIELRKQMAWRN